MKRSLNCVLGAFYILLNGFLLRCQHTIIVDSFGTSPTTTASTTYAPLISLFSLSLHLISACTHSCIISQSTRPRQKRQEPGLQLLPTRSISPVSQVRPLHFLLFAYCGLPVIMEVSRAAYSSIIGRSGGSDTSITVMANTQGSKPNLDRYIVMHVATTCDEHGVFVTKDSAEVIELGWILLDAKSAEEASSVVSFPPQFTAHS